MRKKTILLTISLICIFGALLIGILLLFEKNKVDDKNSNEKVVTSTGTTTLILSEQSYEFYAEQADEIISRLTIEQKVGQLMIVGVFDTTPDYYATKMVQERNIGGFCLLGSNISNPNQLINLNSGLQNLVTDENFNIPLFIAVDQEGGLVNRVNFSGDINTRQNEITSEDEAYSIAFERGEYLRSFGFNMNFSPVIDYSKGQGFIASRSFNVDIDTHVDYSVAMINGYTDAGIISVPKHYLGHGSQESDSHEGFVSINNIEVSEQEYIWNEIFKKSTVEIIMMGHMTSEETNGVPYSMSELAYKEFITEFKYDGLAITDDINMGAITNIQSVDKAGVNSIKSGADIVLTLNFPKEQAQIYNGIVDAVKSGEISEEELNAKVKKILILKLQYLEWD